MTFALACPGSGARPDPLTVRQVEQPIGLTSRFGRCPTCNLQLRLVRNGHIRRHKPRTEVRHASAR